MVCGRGLVVMSVNRTRQLTGIGQTAAERARLERGGELVRVRHGAYADDAAPSALDRHRQLIAGTVPILGSEAVLSHASAGVLHELPSWESTLGRVTVLRSSGGHGSRRHNLHVRVAPLEAAEVTVVAGYRVTSLARTAIDLGCVHSHDQAVAVLDAALRAGADPAVLADTVRAARTRRGVGTARAALGFADGRSESVGESLSRVRIAAAGLPAPQLQVNVFDARDTWLARTDFGWDWLGVLGEFDGRIKYVGSPDEVARTVMQEKLREARLREQGWIVVRWAWSDLADLPGLRRRIRAAFAQADPARIRGVARPS
jgi:hypothetical protein